MTIEDVIKALEGATRFGASEDVPEGSRVIQISDTAARQIVDALRSELRPVEKIKIQTS